nr:hypothetical protein [Tanacetum cinerariifolium]
SEPEMEPEEEDGDDEKSEEDSIEYPTSKGDDDGDDLLKDDADDEDKEESSDSKEEEEEHLALTAPALALHRTPPLLPIPPPISSFPLPLLLPSTSGSKSVPEADMPLRKRARFTTPTGRYKVGESSVVVAARQIRPVLIVADSRRAEIMDYCQSREVHTSTLVTQIEAL